MSYVLYEDRFTFKNCGTSLNFIHILLFIATLLQKRGLLENAENETPVKKRLKKQRRPLAVETGGKEIKKKSKKPHAGSKARKRMELQHGQKILTDFFK